MKKTKLKKGDIVVFEIDGEMEIGYMSPLFKDAIVVLHNSFGRFNYLFPQVKHLTKIGTMPKEWI